VVPQDNCNFCQWHVRRQKHIHSEHVFTGSLEADDFILRDKATPQNPLFSRVLIDAEGNSGSKYSFTGHDDLVV